MASAPHSAPVVLDKDIPGDVIAARTEAIDLFEIKLYAYVFSIASPMLCGSWSLVALPSGRGSVLSHPLSRAILEVLIQRLK